MTTQGDPHLLAELEALRAQVKKLEFENKRLKAIILTAGLQIPPEDLPSAASLPSLKPAAPKASVVKTASTGIAKVPPATQKAPPTRTSVSVSTPERSTSPSTRAVRPTATPSTGVYSSWVSAVKSSMGPPQQALRSSSPSLAAVQGKVRASVAKFSDSITANSSKNSASGELDTTPRGSVSHLKTQFESIATSATSSSQLPSRGRSMSTAKVATAKRPPQPQPSQPTQPSNTQQKTLVGGTLAAAPKQQQKRRSHERQRSGGHRRQRSGSHKRQVSNGSNRSNSSDDSGRESPSRHLPTIRESERNPNETATNSQRTASPTKAKRAASVSVESQQRQRAASTSSQKKPNTDSSAAGPSENSSTNTPKNTVKISVTSDEAPPTIAAPTVAEEAYVDPSSTTSKNTEMTEETPELIKELLQTLGEDAKVVSPNGRILLHASGKSVHVWDLQHQQCVDVFLGHTAPIQTLKLQKSPSGKNVQIYSTSEKEALVWRYDTLTVISAKELRTEGKSPQRVSCK